MRQFQFRLERILSLRRHREKEWERKLAAITGICINLERRVKNLIYEKHRVLHDRFSSKQALQALFIFDLYIRRLDREAERLQLELAENEVKRQEVEKEFLEASKNRKVLQKLKEREHTRYRKKQLLEEITSNDDINTGATARRLSGVE